MNKIVSQQIIDILIKAEDKASETADKVGDKLKKFGDNASKANKNASESNTKLHESLRKTGKQLEEVSDNYLKVGSEGKKGFNQLTKEQQKAVLQFHKMDDEAQACIIAARECGEAIGTIGKGWAINQFENATMDTRTWAGSLEYAKTKMDLLGSDTSSLRGKIQVTGSAIKTYLGTNWDVAKNKVRSFGQNVKTSLQGAIQKMKELGRGAKTVGGGFGFLRSALSMTVGMIGYDLVNSMMQSARESINAAGKFQAFGKRMGMTGEELESFRAECDNMQSSFRKVDMNAVGASAMELGVKLKIPKEQMGDLTKMTAVMSSAFVNEGRTQEDAILAVSDAMDGQFKRLQELGITQDKLKENDWNGNLEDTDSLMKSINKTMDDMGFTETAQGIYTLDDAYQALTVAGGRLLADVVVPLTPLITTAIDTITNGITMLKKGWASLPDWAQDAIAIGALAGAALLLAGYIVSLGGAFAVLETALAPAIAVVGAISAPMVIAVAIIGALVYAVYELGKSFGWWSDVGSMLDAIKAGLQRLWSAFINNPNVQGFLQEIRNAWDDISEALQPVIKWAQETWKELFPSNAEGEVDIVRMIIDAFGQLGDFLGKVVNSAKSAWNTISSFGVVVSVILGPVGIVIGALRGIICALLGCSPGVVPALRKVQEVFRTVWNAIAGFVPGIIRKIVTTIVNTFKQLPGKILTFLKKVGSNILTQGSQWVKNAKNKASSMVSGAVSYAKNLPGKMGSYISSTAHRISSGAQSWVSNAKSKASSMVSGVTGTISGLPGKVYTEFANIGSRMLSAGSGLVNKAKSIGRNIVNGLLNAMKIHSPGEIQEKVVAEFENTLNRVGNMTNNAYTTGSSFGSAIVDGFGDVSLGTDSSYNVYTGKKEVLEVHLVHDHNYSFDGLPNTVSAKEVASMINHAAEDDEWTKKLTSNPRFQKFDLKEKARISNRRARSRGV